MKPFSILAAVSALSSEVAAHATFQQLWVNGKDLISASALRMESKLTLLYGSTCARLPNSNNPVTSVTSNDVRCNSNQGPVASKCSVAPGDTVTVEMHQHNTRGCSEEAIGGAHYGPVMVYMSKVGDASTATGSDPFFKIFQDTWAKAPGSSSGDNDYWGTKDLNTNCGKMDVKIPANLAPGDYLLRAEAIALHSAASAGGAQLYMTCYQITVTGSGTLTPAGVSFPGAYKASDPGLQIDIHRALSAYIAPGPSVIAGGIEAVAGKPGTIATATGGPSQPTPTGSTPKPSTTLATVVQPPPSGGTAVPKWQQCGGNGYSGSTTCESGSKCVKLNDYYSQCQ